ncbi:uncharacterized protein LOC130685542 [Daphnia carinata]|uniref:uncharacterized protein LOC130685542 n=1 Tax=Daphnia carinata TaxID=120202 RepID=UPI00257CD299|nr:uncharacterized protein LOC130685542 [Daphnia carinata]
MNSAETDANGSMGGVDPLQAMKKVLEEYPAGEEFDELIAPVENHLRNEIRKRNCRILLKVSGAATLALVTIFALVTFTPFYYHLRALGRIGLIQLTPYWDWSDYYYRDCLIENTFTIKDDSPSQSDCSACEDIGPIKTVSNISTRLLIDNYINQEVPVIVTDGALDWKVVNDPDFGLDTISEAYRQDDSGRKICQWKSNIFPSNMDLVDFMQQVHGFPFERPWFAHWENCGRKSVKTGRRFYTRPYFITATFDISFNNWILISNYYHAQRFKQVKLHTRLAMMAQIRGSHRLRLLPQLACEAECPVLQLTLLEGEIVLFNPKRWHLEYQPEGDSSNIAFIIQAEMD